jgi:hypothetical protein
MEKSVYDRFWQHRENLIYQYNIGDISKDEFIDRNYEYIQSMDVAPYRRVDHLKKGVFNYQYYNVLAKYYQKKASRSRRGSLVRQDHLDRARHFYEMKDRATARMIEMAGYAGVTAYFVRVHSQALRNKLFEIVFEEYPRIVLHSTNEKILQDLRTGGVFEEGKRHSVVHDYINERY